MWAEEPWNECHYRWEVLQHLSVLLLALHISPLWFIKERVKVVQQWNLLFHADGHVIFHGVKSPENQIKYAYCMAVRKEEPLTQENIQRHTAQDNI